MDEPENSPSSETASDASALLGTIIADRYRVDELLGEGAMGAVFRAEHIHMQKAVALKVLHRETGANAEVVRRFEREAIAAGRVVHAHVATAQDFGQLADGSFYLVLEYVAGESLRHLLAAQGALPEQRALLIASQVASALAAAHAAGIVHRDLKPENVMLLAGSEQDFIKVLDFGLAKLGHEDSTDTKLTKMGAVYGTPQYMAPEQAAGTEVDHRADLYALGVMLYEMLSGDPPFQSEQMVALLIKHMTEDVPKLPATVSRDVARIVYGLLEKKAEDRFQSAELLLAALAGVTQNRTERATRAALTSRGARPGSFDLVAQTSAFKGQAKELAQKSVEFGRVPVVILGRRVPRYLLLVGVLVLGLAPFILLGGKDSTSPKGAASTDKADASESNARAIPGPADPALKKVLDAARQGSDSALYALEQRADDQRSADEWLALSQARLMRREVDRGLAAFGAAIEQDPRAGEDGVVLGALYALTKSEKDAAPILHFVAERLGGVGADFLFFVWAKTSQKNEATTLAAELLHSSAVEKKMSASLSVAMAIREAESCSDYKALLPELTKAGDQRSISKVRDLELDKTRGCGPTKKDDCYPCLREDEKALKEAINQASMRASPQFELGRRFRFLR